MREKELIISDSYVQVKEVVEVLCDIRQLLIDIKKGLKQQ